MINRFSFESNKKIPLNYNFSSDNILKSNEIINNKKKIRKFDSQNLLSRISFIKKNENNKNKLLINPKKNYFFKNSLGLCKYKNLNSNELNYIFSDENSGNIYEGYIQKKIDKKTLKKNTNGSTCSFKSTFQSGDLKNDKIKNLKKKSHSYISLVKPLINYSNSNNIKNINHNGYINYNFNIDINKNKNNNINKKNNINKNNSINENNNINDNNKKFISLNKNKENKIKFAKRYSLLDKLLIKLSYPEETFEDFIHFSKPIRPGDKYKKFQSQLFENKKKIEKMIQNLDKNIMRKNQNIQSFTPYMLKKKYFLKSIYKNNK